MSDSQRYHVSVEQYRTFRRDGFLIVRNLVSQEDAAELRQHTDDLMQGRLPQQTTQMPERDTSRDAPVGVQSLPAVPLCSYSLCKVWLKRQREIVRRLYRNCVLRGMP